MSGVDELFLKTVSYDMFTKLLQVIFNSSLVTIDGKDFFFKRLISTRHYFTHHYFYVSLLDETNLHPKKFWFFLIL